MKSIIGRREFLGVSIALAATSLRAAEPSVNFPTDPRQRPRSTKPRASTLTAAVEARGFFVPVSCSNRFTAQPRQR